MKNTVFTVMTVLLMATLCLPATAQEWEFQRHFCWPHASTEPIDSIGFYGNSQVIFGKGEAIFNWNLSTRRWRSKSWNLPGDQNRIDHLEVSPTHDIVAHTFRNWLYLRRASDLSRIDVVALPGDVNPPDYLTMEPETNYLIVGGHNALTLTRLHNVYDLWENNSWGLNTVTRTIGDSYASIDIFSQTYAYSGRAWGQIDELLYLQREETRHGHVFLKNTDLDFEREDIALNDNLIEVAAARGTDTGSVRIASITNSHTLHVWDWFGNLLYTRQFGGNERPPQSFQFTPNGEILTWINTSLDAIVFWDVSTQELDTPVVPNSNIHVPGNIQGDLPTCHAFSRDGKTMAVGSAHGYVLLYRWTGENAPTAPAKETEAQPTALLSNYPNPFNPETWIPYQLSEAAEVTVTIHASDGKLVRTLELGQMPAGAYSDKDRAAYWDGRNAQGEPVASGVYFYTLTAGDFSATRKMVIRK